MSAAVRGVTCDTADSQQRLGAWASRDAAY